MKIPRTAMLTMLTYLLYDVVNFYCRLVFSILDFWGELVATKIVPIKGARKTQLGQKSGDYSVGGMCYSLRNVLFSDCEVQLLIFLNGEIEHIDCQLKNGPQQISHLSPERQHNITYF